MPVLKTELAALAVIDTLAITLATHAMKNLDNDPEIVVPMLLGSILMVGYTFFGGALYTLPVSPNEKNEFSMRFMPLIASSLLILAASYGLTNEIDDSLYSAAWGGLLAASTLTFGWNAYKMYSLKKNESNSAMEIKRH